jgi:hypothetical protein
LSEIETEKIAEIKYTNPNMTNEEVLELIDTPEIKQEMQDEMKAI